MNEVLTVEECVYWLAVAQATTRTDDLRRPIDGSVRRDLAALREAQGECLWRLRLVRSESGRREALLLWALCRAAARAVAVEGKARKV